jgi:hypothetical protein
MENSYKFLHKKEEETEDTVITLQHFAPRDFALCHQLREFLRQKYGSCARGFEAINRYGGKINTISEVSFVRFLMGFVDSLVDDSHTHHLYDLASRDKDPLQKKYSAGTKASIEGNPNCEASMLKMLEDARREANKKALAQMRATREARRAAEAAAGK